MALAFAACSDVELPFTANPDGVADLQYSIQRRRVTLTWTLPASQDITGVQIIKGNEDAIELEGPQTSYLIKRADTDCELSYTVKARYADGKVSEGQTIRFTVPTPEGTVRIALLTPAGDLDDDEAAAANWFKANVANGDVITAATLAAGIDPDLYGAIWVMVDRQGIGAGWEKLPADLIAPDVLAGMKQYVEDGGNLLLTNHATQLATAIGRCPYAPGIFGDGAGGDNPDTWGLNANIGCGVDVHYDHRRHAAFTGMTKGAYGYNHEILPLIGNGHKEDHNCMWDLNACGFSASEGHDVVAVFEQKVGATVLGTWQHVEDYCCAGMVEFKAKGDFAGKIIAIGTAAYEWKQNSGANAFQSNVEALTRNCLGYLTGTVQEQPSTLRYAMLTATGDLDDDEQAAVDWFKANIPNGDLLTSADGLSPDKYSVVWVAVDREGIGSGFDKLPSNIGVEALKAYVKAGGNLLLTNHATQLAYGIGRTAYAPGIFGDGAGGDNPDTWGLNANIGCGVDVQYDWRGHDIYLGCSVGAHGYNHEIIPLIGSGHKEDHNCMWDLNACGFTPDEGHDVVAVFQQKENARVLGTWQHVEDYCCAGVVEFMPTGAFPGRVIAIGPAAYEWHQNGGSNEFQKNVETITKNCLDYLGK